MEYQEKLMAAVIKRNLNEIARKYDMVLELDANDGCDAGLPSVVHGQFYAVVNLARDLGFTVEFDFCGDRFSIGKVTTCPDGLECGE